MSSLYLILAFVFSLLIAIIALANNDTVTVSYIFGRADVSLILLILGSSFCGALVVGLFGLFRSIRSAFAFRQMRHEQEKLKERIKALEEENLFLSAQVNKYTSTPEALEEDYDDDHADSPAEKLPEQRDETEKGETFENGEVKEEPS